MTQSNHQYSSCLCYQRQHGVQDQSMTMEKSWVMMMDRSRTYKVLYSDSVHSVSYNLDIKLHLITAFNSAE